ncbi:RNA-binding protein [Cyanobacterium sp. Dongsha4]|uniref:RNA-binding protein n=1 Tax=Cyanobacterium sp. DS4 TaxID=2878255 RepID=UPI002E802EDD|nr:RNA-binding protein [Cyanobacterium sp. Dongsha4]WVL00873.1 RNA-binding protein [Cyanobacterium sp. Dongsha4]
MSVRLYVKLPKAEIEKEGLEKMFSDFEPSFTTKLIKERKKKECRGFGFVTVPTDEAAEDFISRYNEKPLVYNGETYKDEEGNDFLLVIEKALPRNKGGKEEGEQQEEAETNNQVEANTDNKPSRRNNGNKKPKKNRKGGKAKTQKAVSVSESIQPDPRWANELNKLKEMFAAQASN